MSNFWKEMISFLSAVCFAIAIFSNMASIDELEKKIERLEQMKLEQSEQVKNCLMDIERCDIKKR